MSRILPSAATERLVETSRGALRVLHAGEGKGSPLLFIHGGGSDNAAISWFRLFEPLSREHEIWAPDLPGFGGMPIRSAVPMPWPICLPSFWIGSMSAKWSSSVSPWAATSRSIWR